jgi:hypothetical protein
MVLASLLLYTEVNNMTLTQYLDMVCEKLNIAALPDRLLTTYLEAIAQNQGVDVSALPDRLATTYLGAILKAKGVDSVPDDLVTTHLEALAKSYGVGDLPDKLISTYLEAIIPALDAGDGSLKIQFTVTGDESFTFSSANKALYFMNADLTNVHKEDIISATCSHFKFGSGNVLADMNDGEFIFNVTVATGLATGNVSFKKSDVFTSRDAGVAWFKEQYANGTPVIVTVYLMG